MSMIARYKRSGGFVQLLSLLETSGQQKRDKFLEIIREESPAWADALETRLISIDRIFKWSDEVVSEIFKGLPTRNLACAIKGISKEEADRILKFMGHGEKRKLEDELATLAAKPEEINATFIKVIEITRKMIVDGYIRLEKVDPSLDIPEDMEEKLEHEKGVVTKPVVSLAEDRRAEAVQEAISKAQSSGGGAEVLQLQRMVQNLSKENKALKDENKQLKERLDQIRKIA